MLLEKQLYEETGKSFKEANDKAKIPCQCDYCGAYFLRLKHNLIRSWKTTKKDSCSNYVCVQKKRTETNQVLFGTDNAFQNEAIKSKIAEKNMLNFGVSNCMQNTDVRKKQQKTCREKYGFDNVFQNKDIKEKIKNKNLKTLGVSNPTQNKEVKKKQEQTLISIYGVPHALQSAELRKKAMDTCVANHGIFPANHYGGTQKSICDWLNSFGFNFKSNRSLIPGSEIDMYDEHKKLGIEYCGLHWHHEFSPEPRLHTYHYNKYKKCLDQGVQLLTIFSDEWEKRQTQCKSHIKSILGVNEKRLYARKCLVEVIDKEAGRKFFDDYHIQGRNNLGFVFFGLIYESEVCGVISLGRHNRQVDAIVLDRLCFKDGIQIVGGASKLFSRCVEWAKENGHKDILSFSDNRWSLGKVYTALDFNLANDYRPDYSYVNIKSPNERLSKQSQKKSVVNCPKDMTEYDWAHARGLARIWDCGKKRWVYNL